MWLIFSAPLPRGGYVFKCPHDYPHGDYIRSGKEIGCVVRGGYTDQSAARAKRSKTDLANPEASEP
jgi:hypothetical protein